MKRIHRIAMVMLLAIGLMTGSTVPVMAESENENGCYFFTVSAHIKMDDGTGNTIDIHGGGKVGTSGGSNPTLVGTAKGTITVHAPGEKKYKTHWEIARTNSFVLTESYLFLKIKFEKPIGGPYMLDVFPVLNLELTEGARAHSGTIVLSTDDLEIQDDLVIDRILIVGEICRGEGKVVIH